MAEGLARPSVEAALDGEQVLFAEPGQVGALGHVLTGASGYSVGLGVKSQSTEVEVDGGFEVLAVAIPTSGNPDRLHP